MLREIVAAAAFILALAGLVGSAVLVQRMSARQEGEGEQEGGKVYFRGFHHLGTFLVQKYGKIIIFAVHGCKLTNFILQ